MNFKIHHVEQWENGEQTLHLKDPNGRDVRITVTGLEKNPSLSLIGLLGEAAQGETDEIINISTQIGSRDLEPYVTFRWGAHACRLTPPEARQHAYAILDAANAAETDGFLIHFFQEKLNLPIEKAAPILADFRQYREAQHLRAVEEAKKRMRDPQ